MSTSYLAATDVTVSFGQGNASILALDNVSTSVDKGEFVSIVGPSGCGKSTLFNVMAGIMQPGRGTISLKGEDVTSRAGHAGYMLQSDLLVPWRTVLGNVTLCKEVEGVSRRALRDRAMQLLQRFGLEQFAHRYPTALSGGMRQRAAMIRTILSDKELFLLDEPFGALDAQTRTLMQEWLLDVWTEFKKTIVFITHDIDEAIYLSDRVYIMSARPGRILSDLTIDLKRPRGAELRVDPSYIAIKAQILDVIREQSILALQAAS